VEVKVVKTEKQRPPVTNLEVVLTATKDMLKNSDNHKVFLSENGLQPLTDCLRKETENMQVLYLGVFSLWLLSFNNKTSFEPFKQCEVVRRLIEVLRKSIHREKVVRITLSTLRNLISVPPFDEEMIMHQLSKNMQPIFSKSSWKDEDALKDAKWIKEQLDAKIAELSSWEKYRAEVMSGDLQWSPAHNDQFFRENISNFEEKNYQVVRALIELLDSKEPLTLEVACHDLGDFARFYQDGKSVIQKFNGKKKIMEHMANPNVRVRKHALLAVQKMMVNNWEYLSKPTNLGNTSASAMES